MRDWSSLIRDVQLLSLQTCQFADDADSTFKNTVEKFNKKTFKHLLSIITSNAPDDVKEKNCRFYLAMRSADVMHGAVDNYLNSGLPSNQGCLKVATFIAAKDEAALQILTPSVKKILGTALPTDLKFSAQDHTGQFQPGRYILNTVGDALISPSEVFEYVWHKNLRCFVEPNIHGLTAAELNKIQEKPLLPLSENDLSSLASVCDEKSRVLFDAIKLLHYLQFQAKPSVTDVIENLCRALKESGKDDQGSDFTANLLACEQPIRDFYQRWQLLDKSLQENIASRAIGNSKETIGVLLSCLFAALGIPISEKEKNDLKYVIITCVDEFAKQLMAILSRHKDLVQVPFPMSHTDLPSEEIFNEQFSEFDAALDLRAKRPVQAGHYGVSQIDTYCAIDLAFSVISGSYDFQKTASNFDSQTEIYSFLFKRLPCSLWRLFCNHMPASFFHHFDAWVQGYIFEELPFDSKKFFIDFIRSHNLLRLSGVEDFKDFFNTRSQASISVAESCLVQDVKKALPNTQSIALVLNHFSDRAWDLFRQHFSDAFEFFFEFDDDFYKRIRMLHAKVQSFYMRCVFDKKDSLPTSLTVEKLIEIAKRLPLDLSKQFVTMQIFKQSLSSVKAISQFVNSVDIEVGQLFLMTQSEYVQSKFYAFTDLESYVLTPSDLQEDWFRALGDKLFNLSSPLFARYLQYQTDNLVPPQSLVGGLRCVIAEGLQYALGKIMINRIFTCRFRRDLSTGLFSIMRRTAEPAAIERRLQADLLDVDEMLERRKILPIECVVHKAVLLYKFILMPRKHDVFETGIRYDIETICGRGFLHDLLKTVTYLFPSLSSIDELRGLFSQQRQVSHGESSDSDVEDQSVININSAFNRRGPLVSPPAIQVQHNVASNDSDDADSFVL